MKRILIADQDNVFSNSLKKALTPLFAVEICNEGMQVLERYYEYTPDLLIVDLTLPGVDGLSMLNILRASGRKANVLVVSGCVYSGYVHQQLTALGVLFILPKPCTVDYVREHVCNILNEDTAPVNNDDIHTMLMRLGLNATLAGYKYLTVAFFAGG